MESIARARESAATILPHGRRHHSTGAILWSRHLTFGAISVTRLVSTDANTPYRGGIHPTAPKMKSWEGELAGRSLKNREGQGTLPVALTTPARAVARPGDSRHSAETAYKVKEKGSRAR